MNLIEFMNSYLVRLEKMLEVDPYDNLNRYIDDAYDLCKETSGVLMDYIPNIEKDLFTRSEDIQRDLKTMAGRIRLKILELENGDNHNNKSEDMKKPIIFLSHNSDDKLYGHALEKLIVGLGVSEKQLIYTSHPLHKIPLDENIFRYLRDNINRKIFMIILWSDSYLDSPACLSEMGAVWVTQNDYTNVYVPNFSFGNPKYHQCPVDTSKMGAILNGDEHCKISMLELKNKIVEIFDLKVTEEKALFLLENFVNDLKSIQS